MQNLKGLIVIVEDEIIPTFEGTVIHHDNVNELVYVTAPDGIPKNFICKKFSVPTIEASLQNIIIKA